MDKLISDLRMISRNNRRIFYLSIVLAVALIVSGLIQLLAIWKW